MQVYYKIQYKLSLYMYYPHLIRATIQTCLKVAEAVTTRWTFVSGWQYLSPPARSAADMIVAGVPKLPSEEFSGQTYHQQR